MKVLFSVITPAYLKNFESTVRELAARGHQIEIAVHGTSSASGPANKLNEILSSELPGVSTHDAPRGIDDRWLDLALAMRSCRDYAQFHRPEFHEVYRARADTRVPDWFRTALQQHPVLTRPAGRRVLARVLPVLERAIPPNAALTRYIRDHDPDVVLFTPYIGLRTVQPDFLTAARAARVPTVACVSSWDNLTSKSLMRPLPDMVTVWNETQREEAIQLHRVPADRLCITGAQCFDEWFDWRQSPRRAFCQRVGLDPERPYVLWTCFSPFKEAPDEVGFVRRWLAAMRASGRPELRDLAVLVRPHPKRGTQWRDVDLGDGAVVWPREGEMVVDPQSKANYFDSIFHSVAVAGINTSAMIEAGVVGRPVHTVLVPEYWASQEGTLHFRYLRQVGGGLLRVGADLDEHFAQLAVSVAQEGAADGAARRFVRAFVRPAGLTRPATPLLADAVERMAVGRVARIRTKPSHVAVRAALGPLADRERRTRHEQEARRHEKLRAREEKAERRLAKEETRR